MLNYSFPTDGASKPESVFCGKQYRITVLTSSLLRLEYSKDGVFEDRATQSVVNRNFPAVPFDARTDGNMLTIETDKLILRYDQRPFSETGLQIEVKEIKGAIWHYGRELHDLKGTYRTLDRVDGDMYMVDEVKKEKIELGTGIPSREGFSVIDDSKSMAITEDGWVEKRKGETDIYFFGYGHRYTEALRDFYLLCGKTPLLPRYALGNWWSRYYTYSEETYKELMLRFEREKLPFSVAVIDMDWHLVDEVDPKYGGGWTGYTWNRKLFPDPERFLNWLHDKNMKVTLNVHPADGVRAFEDIYPQMAEAMGVDPSSGQAVAFDCADPHFMEQYFNVLCHSLEKQGVDFWWIDWQQGTDSKMEGLDPLWILNHFHFLDSSWKGTRPMTFSRYAGVGSHRYPVGFSGDTIITWNSLDYQPYFTNTASNIGYGWWSHDIGGHMMGVRDDEMMTRWVQYGVFSPINRLHSTKNLFSGKEPWRYNEHARNVMGRFLRLRHAMIPYLYTMNRRASRDGLPLIRPLYYEEPEREEAYQAKNEYYFGTELLVSPVTSPSDRTSLAAKTRTWLPAGQWSDFFSGALYEGGRMMDLWRTLDHIPVLMKAGAIVPMSAGEVGNSVENPKVLEVRVFPAADGRFTLWEDEGDTPEDKDENWAATVLTWQNNVFTISAASGNTSILPQNRDWTVAFCSVENRAATVCVDGKRVDAETVYDEDTARLSVTIPDVSVTQTVTVSFAEPLAIADNRERRIYEVLERAQMDYGVKSQVWSAVRASGTGKRADLDKFDLDENVKGCLLEFFG